MLEAYGHIYFAVADALAIERGRLWAWSLQHKNERFVPPGDALHHSVLAALRGAQKACTHVPLGSLSREVDRTLREHESAVIVERLCCFLRNIAERFQDELEETKFIHVSPDLATFYNQDALFGQDVFGKFKQARDDIKTQVIATLCDNQRRVFFI